MTYSKILIVGNLGGDPEIRYTPSGKMVTNFSVAENRTVSGEKQTIWYRVSTWEKLAENCNNYLKKGSRVLIEGRLTADTATGGPRIWTGNDGQQRASFELTAQTVQFLSTRAEDAQQPSGDYQQTEMSGMPPAMDNDIPF